MLQVELNPGSPSLADLRDICNHIQHYGKMLPSPDDDLKIRIAHAADMANQLCAARKFDFEPMETSIALQCLGMLATHQVLGPSIVKKCREIIPDLLKIFAGQVDQVECLVVADSLYWYGYLGEETRRIASNIDSTIQDIFLSVSRVVQNMTPIDIGKVVHAMADLKVRNIELLVQVDRQVVSMFESYKIRDISRILWAYGKLNWEGSQLFRRVVKCFEDETFVDSRRVEFYPQYTAHLCWATGRIGKKEKIIRMLDDLVQVNIHGFCQQCFAANWPTNSI